MSTHKTRYCNLQVKSWAVLFSILGLLLISTLAWSENLKGAAGEKTSQTENISVSPGFDPGDTWLDPYMKQKSLDELFKLVSQKVRFEPYPGMMRGVTGTAISHRGNSLDQALLLKYVLASQGYQIRLATGQLDRKNALILLRGMYPTKLPTFNYPESYDPFRLETSDQLIELVSRHYWVEINQGGGNWLPLDPSFPRARIGDAYARADKYFDQVQDEWQQVISIRLLQTTGDKKNNTIFDLEMPVAEFGYLPLSISCMGVPLEELKPKSEKGGSALGVFGKSINNSNSTKQEPEKPESKSRVLGTRYNWTLNIRGQGSRQSAHDVQFKQADTFIKREWLEITIKTPGRKKRNIGRVLFEAQGNNPENQPALYRRHVLEVFPGTVRPELADAMHARFSQLPIGEWKKSIAQPQKNTDTAGVQAMDETLGSGLLQMILTRFAEASDEATDRAGYRNGVAVIRSVPRVLIASAELDGNAFVFGVDLRLDEVDAVPYPGAPSRTARLFQLGRGMLESAAEGEVLRQFTGKSPVTTSLLMSRAQSDGIPLKVVDASGLNDLAKQTSIPPEIHEVLTASLKGGREIVIPEEPVSIDGADRLGWWQIEKASGRNIGVMDNGLHAGMAEYTMSSNRIGLNPKMGFMTGMIVGADSTLFSISGLMLKHGQVTSAMIKEVEGYLKNVMCSSCPKVEGKVGGSISLGGDCLKVEAKKELSSKVAIDFCEEYVNGFKCAAGLLMAGLTGQSVNQAEIKHEISFEAGCKEGKKEMGVSRGF